MNHIRDLHDQLNRAREQLQRAETATEITGLSQQLTLASLRAHVGDLQQQLRAEKELRKHEVIELLFEGRRAIAGMMPVYVFSRAVSAFADAVHASAQKLKTGARVKRLSPAIVSELNLQLADVLPGSSRLLFRGNLNPDLFGASLLEDALDQTFSILTYEDEDALGAAVASAGIRSARGLREMLGVAYSAGMALCVDWERPDGERFRWEGSNNRVGHIASMLGTFSAREPERLELFAHVVALSLRGRFELATVDRIIAGEVPRGAIEQIRAVHVGDRVRASVERIVVVNTVTGTEKSDYRLLSIQALPEADSQ